MTKAKIYSKKVLSIFLAILMCLTIIPLVSETAPEADAATAGLYDIKVELTVTNGADGWDQNDHYVNHKSNNGTGTQTAQSVGLSTGNMDEEKTHTFTYTSKGFPTSYTYNYSFGGGFTWRDLEFTLKVYASKAGANSWKEVISGSFYDKSSAFSAAKGTWTVNASTNIAAPASISWTNTAKSVTVPKTGTATVATQAATVYDQYGVEWYQEPYYALGTSKNPTSTNATISGITRTTSMANTCTVSVTNAARTWVDNGGSSSRDVYVTAYINSVLSSTTKVTVNQVMYNVKFYNGDTLLNIDTSNQKFYYNKQPAYNGVVSKDADAQYTYTPDGWTVKSDGSGTLYTNQTIPVATADTSYYAHYSTVTNQYKVTFENYDGTVLQSGKLNYGTLPVYGGETPIKPNTPEYTYTFAGWSPEVSEVEKEIVYTAQFTETKNKYTVEFCNDNGDTLDVQTLEYGATPVYHGATPTKVSDAQYTYVFAGWSPEIEPVTTQTIYTATYEAKLNSYEVVFKNEDGTVLQSSSYDYGTTPSCGITPVKASDAQYDYTFAGWSPAITTVTGNQEYTALFTPVQKEYTVYYKNYDGSALTEENVSYGDAAQMADALTPSKPSSDGKTYVFAGWSADLSSVTKNTYAVAQYAVEGAENYWVTFVDTDGSVLYKTIVEEGGTAVYGAAAPVKEGYEFVGWDKSLENVTADMTVTALYSKDGEQYVVTFVDWDDTFIKSEIVNHGEAAVAPDDPEREGDENTVYKFSGWDKDISNVTENLVVKATYSVHTHEYNTFVENVVPASCTENSIDKFSCSCGLTKDIEAEDSKDMSNHTGTLTLTGNKKETCTENGYSGDMVCDACNNVAIKGEVITAPGHNAGEIVVENVKDGSCTVPGTYEEVSYCTVCNEEVSRESKTGALLPHTSGETVIENNVEADCENDGSYDEVVYCTVCDKELSRDTIEVPKLGHKEATAVTENEVEAECEKEGSYDTVVYCSVCKKELSRVKTTVDALGHEEADAVIEKEVAADCENAGSYDEVVYCTVCDKELSRDTIGVPKLGHKEATAVTENEVAAECEKEGSYDTVVYCSVCKKELSRVTTTVDATDHDWDEWVTVTPATCGADGLEKRVCKNNSAHYEENVIKATGEHVYATEVDRKDATCTEDGYVIMACGCGATEKTDILSEGHKEAEAVTENEVAAGCETEGSYDTVVYCSVCGEELSRVKTIVPAKDHTEAAAVVENEVEADCENAGSYDEVVYCTVCNKELSRDTIEVPKLGHKEAEAVTENEVAAECENDGSYDTVVYCSVCNKELSRVTTTVPATDHDWGEWQTVTPASCGADGLEKRVCKNNSAHYEENVIKATGEHVYATEVDRKDATCTEDGYVIMACGCGATEKTDILSEGHKEAEAVTENEVAAGCETEGSYETVVYCSVCGEELSRVKTTVPAKDHTEADAVVENEVAADCENDGSYDTVVYCSVCNKELSRETTTVDALGHKEADAVIENEVAAGCETEGSYDTVVYCSVCNKELSRVTTTVDALGHEEAEAVTENEVAADCENDGSYDTVVYCSICNKELSRVTTTVDALGHEEEELPAVAPDCLTDGLKAGVKCTVCGKILVAQETDPALGHNMSEFVETKAPSCSEKGEERSDCSRCDYYEVRELAKLAHTEETVSGKAPTCTENGLTDGIKCSVCGEAIKTQTVITAPGHKYGEWVVYKQPTCSEEGQEIATCTVCSAELYRSVAMLEHNYDDEGTCKDCGAKGSNCRHICHRQHNIFARIVWGIIIFICKIFGLAKTCSCGASHY